MALQWKPKRRLVSQMYRVIYMHDNTWWIVSVKIDRMEALLVTPEEKWALPDKDLFGDKSGARQTLQFLQSAATATTGSLKAIRESIQNSEKQLETLQNLLPLSPPTVKTLDDLVAFSDMFPFKEKFGHVFLAANAFKKTVDLEEINKEILLDLVEKEAKFMELEGTSALEAEAEMEPQINQWEIDDIRPVCVLTLKLNPD